MATIQAIGVTVQVVSVNLTKSVLKQLPIVGYEELKQRLDGKSNLVDGVVIGWVHGSVLDRTEEYKKWLIVRTGPTSYGRYDAMDSTCKKYQQLIIA